MAGSDVVRTITIRGRAEGVDKLVSDLKGLSAAQKDVAVASESSSRSQLSAAKSLERVSRQYDIAYRQQQELAKVTAQLDRARSQGLISEQRQGELLNMVTASHARLNTAQGHTAVGQKSLADSTKLARYELINLSRQVQDVGVSLASGQSFGTVLIQQGSQIADVFASSQGTVRGFFQQAIGWGARFVTSMAGAVTGVLAIGAGALYAATSWSTGQREIEKALSGIGRASGVTRDQINSIAETSATQTAASISEAREAATIFAGTGKIYALNVQQATDITKDFARATGTDMTAAAKTLAAALVDPVKGAQDLNQAYGFLDGKTLQLIRTLETQNQHQEAQRTLMNAAAPAIKAVADNISFIEKAWDAATKAASNYIQAKARTAAQGIEFATGANLGGFSDEQKLQKQLALVKSIRDAMQEVGPRGQSALAERLVIETAALGKMQAAARQTAEAVEDKRFREFSLAADEAVRSLLPEIEQVEKLTKQINDLKRAKEGVSGIAAGYGGEAKVDPTQVSGRQGLSESNDRAAASAELLRRTIRETAEVAARYTTETLKTAAAYQGVSVEVSKILDRQRDQLAVAEAVTGQQRLSAQEAATYNQLVGIGRSQEEATRVSVSDRAIAQAQLNAGAQQQLASLQDQFAVASSVTGQQRMLAEAAATFNGLLRQGVDAYLAMQIAAQQLANSQAQVNAAAQASLLTLQDQAAVAGAYTAEEKISAEAVATRNKLLRDGVDGPLADQIASQQASNALASEYVQQQKAAAAEAERAAAQEQARAEQRARQQEAYWAQEMASIRQAEAAAAEAAIKIRNMRGGSGFFSVGGPSQYGEGTQFKPGGYESTSPQFVGLQRIAMERFGQGGFEWDNFRNPVPNQQGLEKEASDTLTHGGTVQDAIDRILKSQPQIDQNSSGLLNRLIELLPDADQPNVIQQEIAKLREQPVTLARNELIDQLTESLNRLMESTNGLKESTDSLKVGLSDLYGSDPRTSHIGYRSDSGVLNYDPFKQPATTPVPTAVPVAVPTGGPIGPNSNWGRNVTTGTVVDPRMLGSVSFAEGGIMTEWGRLQLRKYSLGGIARSPQLSLHGEGSTPEAYVPVPSGRIPVQMMGINAGNDNKSKQEPPLNITINQTFNGPTNSDDVKRTSYQSAQDGAKFMRAGAR